MSYILDALRRADAERERGRVPGLHAQAVPLRAGDAEAVPRERRQPRTARTAVMAVAFLVLAVLATVIWRSLGGTDVAGPDLVAPAQPASAVTAAATPPSTTPAAPATATTPAPVPIGPAVQRDAPVAAAAPILAPPPSPAIPAAPARPPTGARTATTRDDESLTRVADLPPTLRAGLPPLQVSGTTYAENPALRMLILDGKVLQEGQDIAAGLRLESIGPRSAVLNHQGRRLRLTY